MDGKDESKAPQDPDQDLPEELGDGDLDKVSGGMGGNIPNAPPKPITIVPTPPATRPSAPRL